MRSVSATIHHTLELDESDVAYDFELTATIYPGRAASMYGGPDHVGWPEEPTEVEITDVRLERLHIGQYSCPGHRAPFATLIERAFRLYLDKQPDLLALLEEQFCQDASDAEDYYREESYQRDRELREEVLA